MRIEPNTNIKLYHNIPIDMQYKNTLYFANQSAQNAYFHTNSSILKYAFTAHSYQRVNSNTIKVEVLSDNIYDCNYLAFQNTAFGSKWFYGFITGIEYISNTVSQITYEIDVIQTYFFDITFNQCLIERQHTETDFIGEHLISENIAVTSYVNTESDFTSFNPYDTEHSSPTLAVGIYYVDSDNTSGNLIGKVFSGYKLWSIRGGTDIQGAIQTKLSSIYSEGYGDKIAAIFMYPYICGYYQTDENQSEGESLSIFVDIPNNLDGYVPKNNKLFTYPYCFVKLDNMCGGTNEYYFEWSESEDKSLHFVCVGNMVTQPSVLTFATQYNGRPQDYETAINTANFPMCSYALDGFQNYISANKVALSANLITSTLTSIAGFASGGVVGGLMSAGSSTNLVNTATSLSDKYATRIGGKGQVLADGLLYNMELCGIYAYTKTVNAGEAKVIDDYFTKYGYRLHELGIPNRHARPQYTYVQTIECSINGSCPADDIQKICDIHNSGITYWVNPANVGNYEINNAPISEVS